MSHMLDKDTVNRIMHLHKVQGLEARVIAERFGFSSSRVHGVIRRQAPSVKPQATLTMDQGYCRMNLEREEIWK